MLNKKRILIIIVLIPWIGISSCSKLNKDVPIPILDPASINKPGSTLICGLYYHGPIDTPMIRGSGKIELTADGSATSGCFSYMNHFYFSKANCAQDLEAVYAEALLIDPGKYTETKPDVSPAEIAGSTPCPKCDLSDTVCALYYKTEADPTLVKGSFTRDCPAASIQECLDYMNEGFLSKPACNQTRAAVFAEVVLIPLAKLLDVMPEILDSEKVISIDCLPGGDPTPTPTPTPDIVAPTSAITQPADLTKVKSGHTVMISATATDNIALTHIELFIDGNLKTTSSGSPIQYKWVAAGNSGSSHPVLVQAYDAAGNMGSAGITLIIK